MKSFKDSGAVSGCRHGNEQNPPNPLKAGCSKNRRYGESAGGGAAKPASGGPCAGAAGKGGAAGAAWASSGAADSFGAMMMAALLRLSVSAGEAPSPPGREPAARPDSSGAGSSKNGAIKALFLSFSLTMDHTIPIKKITRIWIWMIEKTSSRFGVLFFGIKRFESIACLFHKEASSEHEESSAVFIRHFFSLIQPQIRRHLKKRPCL